MKEASWLPGIAGEIWVGGIQVSEGYLHRPELTAEKFIPDPFMATGEGWVYRTGDFGRWLPDGNIEYIGRRDEQVNVHGYRIETGEIESLLRKSGDVKDAVVMAREDR